MDRSRFESELRELLGDAESPDRERRIEALRRRCDEHPGGRELVALATRLPGALDPVPDPGPAYWKSFGIRLRERIRADERRRRTRPWALAGSVAAGLLLSLAVWSYWPFGGTGQTGRSAGGPARGMSGPGFDEPILTGTLEQRLSEADPEALLAMELLAGPEDEWKPVESTGTEGRPDGDDGWLFPETYDLDPEGREALLDWIREQEIPEGGQG